MVPEGRDADEEDEDEDEDGGDEDYDDDDEEQHSSFLKPLFMQSHKRFHILGPRNNLASKELITRKKGSDASHFSAEKLLEKSIEAQRNGKHQFWKKPDTLIWTFEHWDMPKPWFTVE